jgi:hypothetical protein
MFKHLIVIASLGLTTAAASSPDAVRHDEIRRCKTEEVTTSRRVIHTTDDKAMATRVDKAVEKMVAVGTYWLRREGYDTDADRIEGEYGLRFKGYLSDLLSQKKDIGDYAPLSDFLTRLHTTLEDKLGREIMQFTHLEDIKTINYTIPVVFHLDTIPPGAISPAEYKKHFVPLAGVTAFWSVSIACDVGTWGTGYWIICTPAGIVAKYAVVEYIAPPSSPRWYNVFYNR